MNGEDACRVSDELGRDPREIQRKLHSSSGFANRTSGTTRTRLLGLLRTSAVWISYRNARRASNERQRQQTCRPNPCQMASAGYVSPAQVRSDRHPWKRLGRAPMPPGRLSTNSNGSTRRPIQGPNSFRWQIGDALERVADDSVEDDLIALARDARHGRHRALVVAALGNLKRSRQQAMAALSDLLIDPDLRAYAIMGLGKMRAAEARPWIEPFLEDPEDWVRREARKALARLKK